VYYPFSRQDQITLFRIKLGSHDTLLIEPDVIKVPRKKDTLNLFWNNQGFFVEYPQNLIKCRVKTLIKKTNDKLCISRSKRFSFGKVYKTKPLEGTLEEEFSAAFDIIYLKNYTPELYEFAAEAEVLNIGADIMRLLSKMSVNFYSTCFYISIKKKKNLIKFIFLKSYFNQRVSSSFGSIIQGCLTLSLENLDWKKELMKF
jgi:hypothetical protein